MKPYVGRKGIAPPIPFFSTRWDRMVNFRPQTLWSWSRNSVPMKLQTGYILEIN